MKQIAMVFAAILLITACKKSITDPANYAGTWELTKVAGDITINYPAGNGNLFKFSGNNYQKYANGVLVKSGTFTIVSDNSATASTCHNFAPGQFTTRIVFYGDYASPKIFTQLSGNTLTLVSGCFANDAGSFSYYNRK